MGKFLNTIMRNSILTQAGIVIISSTLFLGCNDKIQSTTTSGEAVQEANKEMAKAEEDLNLAIAEFQKESAALITANEERIAEIKLEIAEASMDNRSEFQEDLAEIEAKNAQLKEKLSDYKDDGTQKWDDFKEEFNRDMKALGTAFSDLTVNNTQ
ncbi:hypothetical protein [Robiginitalea sp. SC105]|uniref:hypothetical protein n=1 Tax=Robiginitalea sp. SC105 TaxID=2762332 RepID=UPI00163A8239|nr:hypothetical protein [Robiginitalea sp. SC105]MBC2839826.1 hypothetical protein [Robiginitalea sp. SC105]